jgi:hypothetical protein
LERSYLHQMPAADWAGVMSQGHDKLPSLLLELNKRQSMVRQLIHDVPQADPTKRLAEGRYDKFAKAQTFLMMGSCRGGHQEA